MAREIKNECMGSGPRSTSAADRDRGWVRCAYCGRVFNLRKGSAGLVVDRSEHSIPRHSNKARK